MTRVAGLMASRGHNHVLDTEVHTDVCASLHMMSAEVGLLGQGLDLNLATKRDEVAPTGIMPNRDHLGHAFNLTAPAQLERPKFGQHQPMVAGRKRPVHLALVELIAHRLRRVLLFKLGIFGTALKEALKSMVLVTQHLGQNGAVGLTEPGALAPLERRNLAGNINARKALTVLLVRLGTALKGMIPDMPCAAEVLRKLLLLSGIWIKAEFISLANHRAILAASPWDCCDPVHSSGSPSLRTNFTMIGARRYF
jgi:hypothetical protein